MPAAYQCEVVQGGTTPLRPFDHVVGFAPARRPVTAREGTTAVPDGQRPAQAGGHDPLAATHIQRHPGRAEQNPGDLSVAAQPGQDRSG